MSNNSWYCPICGKIGNGAAETQHSVECKLDASIRATREALTHWIGEKDRSEMTVPFATTIMWPSRLKEK